MRYDRRQHPRISATGPMRARFWDQNLDLVVLDLSLGGLRAESATALSIGGDYVCEVQAGGKLVSLAAKVVRCRLKTLQPKPVFEVGLAFLNPENAATQAAIDALLSQVMSALQVDTAAR